MILKGTGRSEFVQEGQREGNRNPRLLVKKNEKKQILQGKVIKNMTLEVPKGINVSNKVGVLKYTSRRILTPKFLKGLNDFQQTSG